MDSCGRIVTVVVNITDEVQYFKKGEIVGYFSPIEDNILEKGLACDSIDAVFGHFSREPEDPAPGSSSVPLSEEDRKFMLETVSI